MFDELENLIDRKIVRSVYAGKSVTDSKRFATLRNGANETVATGEGDTCTEALLNAVAKVSRPKMPGVA